MGDLSDFSVTYILLFSAFVAPGAVSIFVYRLIRPSAERTLKEIALEAVTFSLMNFSVLFWAIAYAVDPSTIDKHPFVSWLIIVFCFFIVPAFWPFCLVWVLNELESRGIIVGGAKTAWDKFFGDTKVGCWLVVDLHDGKQIGGRFSRSSYASAFPREGHIYIQELWELDSDGNFVRELPGPQGAILRPTDYHFVRVFRSDHDRR